MQNNEKHKYVGQLCEKSSRLEKGFFFPVVLKIPTLQRSGDVILWLQKN